MKNRIAIQVTAQMAADKEAIGLSRVHMYESKCILPLRDNSLFCSCHDLSENEVIVCENTDLLWLRTFRHVVSGRRCIVH